MKKKNLFIILIIFISIGVLFCGCIDNVQENQKVVSDKGRINSSFSEEKPVYIVGIDGEYPPYSFLDKNGEAQGLDVESIKWIGDDMGFNVKFQPVSWDEIIPELLAKKIDMVYSGMTITEERKEVVNFSNPYLKINQSIAAHNETNLSMEDFYAGIGKIGAQRGTTGAFWVEGNLVNKSILPADMLITYDNFPLVATDLLNKRVDFIIYDRSPMLDEIEGKPLHIIGDINTGEEYGVAIRKDDELLLNKINEGLEHLIDSPKWEELKKKYEKG